MRKIFFIFIITLLSGCTSSSNDDYYNECDKYCGSYEEEIALYKEFNKYTDSKCFYLETNGVYSLDFDCLDSLNIPYHFVQEVIYTDDNTIGIYCDDTYYDFGFYSVSVFGNGSNYRLEYSDENLSFDEFYYCSFEEGNCSTEELLIIMSVVEKWKEYFPYDVQRFISFELIRD